MISEVSLESEESSAHIPASAHFSDCKTSFKSGGFLEGSGREEGSWSCSSAYRLLLRAPRKTKIASDKNGATTDALVNRMMIDDGLFRKAATSLG